MKRSTIVALVACLALPRAAEATTILFTSEETNIITPGEGAIYWVDPSFPFANVTITATSEINYSYQAGDGGETFTHVWTFVVDGLTVAGLSSSSVLTAAPREAAIGYLILPIGYWTYTNLFPVGEHVVRVGHRVFMSNSQVISIDNDFHTFHVIPTPEPASLVLLGTGLTALAVRRGRRKARGSLDLFR